MSDYKDDLMWIQFALMDALGVDTVMDEQGDRLASESGFINAIVVTPHDGTEDKWMIRLSPAASFDRWANSRYIEEFFITADKLRHWLYDETDEIVRGLFEMLSDDYVELRDGVTT